jgi:hypothetical protein
MALRVIRRVFGPFPSPPKPKSFISIDQRGKEVKLVFAEMFARNNLLHPGALYNPSHSSRPTGSYSGARDGIGGSIVYSSFDELLVPRQSSIDG